MSQTQDILEKLKDGSLESPNELSDYLVQLSASLMSAGGFELEARIAYSKKWMELKSQLLDSKPKSDKYVDMEVMQTEEYKLWQKMVIAGRTMTETIRSLKKKLRALEIEATL